jgi:hypothetical protein
MGQVPMYPTKSYKYWSQPIVTNIGFQIVVLTIDCSTHILLHACICYFLPIFLSRTHFSNVLSLSIRAILFIYLAFCFLLLGICFCISHLSMPFYQIHTLTMHIKFLITALQSLET